jgi:hypothetical protein
MPVAEGPCQAMRALVRSAVLAAAFGTASVCAAAGPSLGEEVPPLSVRTQLDALAPQRPGVIDLYAVVVGADSEEDVFRKEALAVKGVLENRFDGVGRIVTMINSRAAAHPEATLNSLKYVLQRVAGHLDPNEDMLLLHFTTHGSSDHVLLFTHPSVELRGLSPHYLRSLLAGVAVRYRIIVVSACYAGGFVAPLSDPGTLIVTAAASSRQSYGCGNDSQITDFSRAFYLQALRTTLSLPEAARLAQQAIHRDETAAKLPHSYPQIQLGRLIDDRLKQLEARLKGAAGPTERPGN